VNDTGRHVLRVCSHAAVRAGLQNPDITADMRDVFDAIPPMNLPQRDWHPADGAMWSHAGTEHEAERTLIREPFGWPVLRQLAGTIRAIADRHLAAALKNGTGKMDIMGEYARPVAQDIICELLGIDLHDAPLIGRWADEFAAAPDYYSLPPQQDMIAYFTHLLGEYRRQPGTGGIIGHLIGLERQGHTIAGSPLNNERLLGYLFSLWFAGYHTTASGIGNTLYAFVENKVLEELAGDRTLLPGAANEGFRSFPTFSKVPGWATKSMNIAGFDVQRGQMIEFDLWEANHDAGVFYEPERFDIHRNANRHLAFGAGPHICLGKPLAELEARIMVEALLDDVPRPLSVDPERPAHRRAGFVDTLLQAGILYGQSA
jgi:cytochrome P450